MNNLRLNIIKTVVSKVFVVLLFFIISTKLVFASNWKEYYEQMVKNYNEGNVKLGVQWGEKALENAISEFGFNSVEHEKTLFVMVDLYYYTHDLTKTLETAKLDSIVSKNVYGESSQYYCGSLNNLGLTYFFNADYSNAENVLFEAKTIQEKMQNVTDSAYSFTLNNLALVYETNGKFSLSEKNYLKSLEVNKDTSGNNYAETINNLAALYRRLGIYPKADTLYQKSLILNRRLKGERHPDIALIYNNLGDLYKLMGKYDEAEKMYEQSVELRKELLGKENSDYAKSISNLALLYFTVGRYKQAEDIFLEALKVQLKTKGEEHPEYTATLNNLALLYDAMGRLTEADSLYIRTLELFKKKFGEEHPFYATTLDNLAKLYRKMGKLDKSEEMFLKAKAIRFNITGSNHPDYAKTLFNLAELYSQLGRYDEAEKLFKEALEIRKSLLGAEHPDYAKGLSGMAVLYKRMQKYDEAEPYYNQAFVNYINQIRKFFPYMSEKEKLQFWMSVRNIFEDFTSFSEDYYKQKQEISRSIYDNFLLTKGLILSSTKKIINKIRESKDKGLIDLLNKWVTTKNYWLWLVQNPLKAVELKINVDSVANLANDMEKVLSSKSEDFEKAYSLKEIHWEDVLKALKPNEAAIEVIRYTKNTFKTKLDEQDTVHYGFLIITNETKNQPKLVVLDNGNELENKYIKLYGNLVKIMRIQQSNVQSDLEVELLKSDQELLYDVFWRKVQNELKGIKVVYLSLDGVYNSINLMTLRDREKNCSLIDEIDIRVLTNTKDLVEYRNQEKVKLSTRNKKVKTTNSAVLFGDPMYQLNPDSVQRISALPGTRDEIESISSEMISKKWKIDVLFGSEATEENIKKVQNPKILHIATHGYFEKDIEPGDNSILGVESERAVENPLLRSMLFFAGVENLRNDPNLTTTNDGKLTAYEAMDLNLENTEIVIMSACETGLGEVKNGEGVYGLQRAFQVAGTRSLIMSLWTVSDEATQVLMSAFYKKYLNGMDKRKAFRETQLELKTVYPQFYYWGAFVMVGD